MFRILLAVLAALIIFTPYAGFPGNLEDMIMQAFAAVIFVLVLLLPRNLLKREKVEKEYGRED